MMNHPWMCSALIGCVLAGTAGAQPITYRPIIISGQAAAGGGTIAPANATVGYSMPAIDDFGRFVCFGTVTDPITSPAILAGRTRGAAPTVRIVARRGGQVAGLAPGVQYAGFYPDALLASGGRVIFGATILGPGVTTSDEEAWFLEPMPGEPPVPLIREGDPAPGLPGVTINTLNALEQHPSTGDGVIAFNVLLSAGAAVWRCSVHDPLPQPLAVTGRQIPGQPAGRTYASVSSQPRVSDQGEVVLVATMAGAGVSPLSDTALLMFAPGSTAPVVLLREGQVDAISGQGLGNISPFELAVVGQRVALSAGFQGSLNADRGLLVGSLDGSEPFRFVTIPGQPGPFSGTTLRGVQTDCITINTLGRAVYSCSLAGSVTATNNTVLLSELVQGPGTRSILGREGSAVPSLPPSPPLTFGEFSIYADAPTHAAANIRAQTLFSGTITGTGVTTSNDFGIWAVNPSGTTQLVCREGGMITLAPGDTRTITAASIRRRRSDQPDQSWLNSAGEFVLDLTFSGGARGLYLGAFDTCLGDFNLDNAVTVQDLFEFLDAWFVSYESADFNGGDGVTVQDVFDYLDAWFAGCPE